ncbi:beta strand repeat-containing protein [Pleomorphomonas oryzae]|uniref:beta strand repeat-containing protein n=1 Tax=Pleomorphomonas oryzae TaxID=261934 RepID=UPI00146CB9BE|nr:GLUG motif-containing protein [Pleomorphomonas oryzae]
MLFGPPNGMGAALRSPALPAQLTRYLAALLLASTAIPAEALAGAILPTGGTVVTGSASIDTGPSSVTVNQSSATGIINWNSFSIGAGNSVQFNNGSGSTLSRVTGNVTSEIDGALSATGTLYLVNPAGVVVGSSGSVLTGGSFIASAHDISNDQYLNAGAIEFSGTSTAAVINAGTIASANGDVALIASKVENSGSISAPNGTAALVAGYDVLMSDAAGENGKFSVKVGGGGTSVVNTGTIKAAEIEMRANGGNVYALAGNTDAVVKATGVTTSGGRIFLTAGSGGTVKSTAHLVARKHSAKPAARPADLDGGAITVTGGTVDLAGTVDASAEGQGTKGGILSAIATGHGSYAGDLLATGGIGGDIETSGATVSIADGIHVDTLASGGIAGNWLIDPYNVTISNGAASGSGYTATTDDTVINAATLANALASTGVTISTGAGGGQAGNITVAAALSWGAATTLTLTAAGDIAINAAITAPLGGLTLNAGTETAIPASTIPADGKITLFSGGTITDSAALDVGTFTLNVGNWVQNGASLPAFHASNFVLPGQTGTLSGGVLTVYGGSFLRAAGGDGSTSTPYVITDIYGLQGLNSLRPYAYALGNDIDASGTAGWNNGAGFLPIGSSNGIFKFNGSLDGRGHSITALTINRPGMSSVGLFGYAYPLSASPTVTIENLSLLNASIKGNNEVGALVGHGAGVITNVRATGTVEGGSDVGGLFGYLEATPVTNASADVTVHGTNNTGGLLGEGYINTITASHATGNVSGDVRAGGLIGTTYQDNVYNVYATGNVSGSSDVGGLIGSNAYNNLHDVYATGAVSGDTEVGGLIGTNAGASVSYAYALGSVTGSGDVGGLVGRNTLSGGNITNSYATGRVIGTTNVGGLVGNDDYQVSVSNSYWDTITTGQSVGCGLVGATSSCSATGLTTDQFNTASNFSGWTFGTTPGGSGWVIVDAEGTLNNAAALAYSSVYPEGGNGLTRPFLLSEWSSTITNMHQLELMALDLSAHYTLASDIDAASELSSGPSGMWRVASNATAQGYGFVSIGDIYWQTLTGTLDGAGHTISNLSIYNNDPSIYAGYVGLFSVVGSGGLVENLGLQGGSVYSRGGPVGALVGGNAGTIRNSHASTSVDGGAEVGGLVGDNGGAIEQSYATGDVHVRSSAGGGLAGVSTGTITQSYATGAVSGGNGVSSLGGLVGSVFNGGSVAQSYASGAVTGGSGSSGIGGLLGYLDGSITDTYSVGAVTVGSGSQAYGGLVGLLYAGGITDSYFAQESGLNAGLHGIGRLQSTYAPSDIGVTGETISALKDASTYAPSWDFSLGGVWGVNAYTSSGLVNGGLPFFQWEHPIVASITANDQTTIYNGTATGDGFSQTGYSVAYANGYSSADNLLTNVTLTISGGNVNAGTTNAIDISATPTGSYAVMLAGGTESIAARSVTVTADNLTRAVGQPNPALTYTASGLINGDTLTGGLITAALPSSSPGQYAITEGTLAASANYALSFLPGTLTVEGSFFTDAPRQPNSYAAAQGRATPALGPPLSFVSGTPADGFSWQTLVNRPTGSVTPDGDSGASSGTPEGFALTFAPGTFEVTSFSMASNSSGSSEDQTTSPSCVVGVAGGGLGNVPYPCN